MPKVIVHREGQPDPEIVEPKPGETVRELLGADDEGISVYLDGDEEALDPEARVEDVGVKNGSEFMVAKGPRTEIAITVEYNLVPKNEDWKPQQKVRNVFSWAVGKKGFDLAPDQRPEHELALPGNADPVDLDTPVGVYAGPDHKITFELRRKGSFQG